MRSRLLRTKLKISVISTVRIFRSWKYVTLSVLATLAISGLVLWSLNLELLKYIIFEAPISFLGKLDFFTYGYRSVFTTYDSAQSVGLILLSVLFGINTALFVYVIRRQGFKSVPKKSGIGAFGIAIISGGCVACGTSLVAPLLATLGATSSAFLRDLSTILNWLGSVLLLYSIYKLSHIAATIQAKERLSSVD